MGYHVELEGGLSISPTLAEEHREYLEQFNEKRRMHRDPDALEDVPDPAREAVGLPIGEQGEFYTGSTEFAGQDFDHPSVIDGSPKRVPSPWCPWRPTPQGDRLVWDETEKPGDFINWLEWLLEHLLGPWGYRLEGEIHWEGEAGDDAGTIYVRRNEIEVVESGHEPMSATLTQLRSSLRSGKLAERLEALQAVAPTLSNDSESVELLGEALTDEHKKVRRAAADILQNLVSEDANAIERIIEPIVAGLRDSESKVRAACATALGAGGMKSLPWVPALKELLDDPEESPRQHAAAALAQIAEGYQELHSFKFAAGNRKLLEEFRSQAYTDDFGTSFYLPNGVMKRYVQRCEELGLVIVGMRGAQITDGRVVPNSELDGNFPELPESVEKWDTAVTRGAQAARKVLENDNSASHYEVYVFDRSVLTND